MTFVELCAGTAALSLRLHGGRYARPPVSRMGAKTGYARAILQVMGLAAGDGADRYLWCEPDPGCRLLLEAYRSAELAQQAADIIRGWSDEDPRTLWERLRAEGPVQGVTAREAARWCYQVARGHGGAPGSYCPEHQDRLYPSQIARGDKKPGTHGATREAIADRLPALPTLPAAITTDARKTAPLHSSAVVYIDPPYKDTTSYQHDLTRAEVMALAMKWSDAGADVYISEAEPIDLPGWYHVDITRCRQGQKRTFSKQQAEWLTCSKEPAWLPPQQGTLF